MDFGGGFVSNEHQKLVCSAVESADQLAIPPLQMSTSPKSPKSPESLRSPKEHEKHNTSRGSPTPKSPRSPKSLESLRLSKLHEKHNTSKGSPTEWSTRGKGRPVKHDRHSNSPKNGYPKKGNINFFPLFLLLD